MTGLATELLYAGRPGEGSRLASEQMALLESIGDPTLTIGLAFVAFINWFDSGEFGEILRWSQIVIDLAGGDPAKAAGFGLGSPLAIGLAFRGVARWWLGRPGWRQDLHDAFAMARNCDPATLTLIVAWTYGLEIAHGVLRADDSAVRASEEAVRTAQGASSDIGLIFAKYGLVSRCCIGTPRPNVTAGWRSWCRPASGSASGYPRWSRSPSWWPPRSGPGAATAIVPYR
jgi:hypothetical protein